MPSERQNEKAPAIAALRAALAKAELEDPQKQARVPLGARETDIALQGGLRRGALHEISAQGGHEAAASGFAAALAYRVAGARPVLWIRQDFSAQEFGEVSATGFLELGFDPARLILLRVKDGAGLLRAGHDALACAALGAVVMESPAAAKTFDLSASQRLALAGARKGVTVFLLSFNARPQASAAETRWHISARRASWEDRWDHPLFEAQLARNRHGRTGCWILQWSADDGFFRAPRRPAHFGAVVPAASHGSAAAGLESRTGTDTA